MRTYRHILGAVFIMFSQMAAVSVHAGHGEQIKKCEVINGQSMVTVNVKSMAKQLLLSDQQITEIQVVVENYSTPLAGVRDKLDQYHAELINLKKTEPIDNQAILVISRKQAQVLQDAKTLRNNFRSEIDNILTPEQRDHLASMHKEQ